MSIYVEYLSEEEDKGLYFVVMFELLRVFYNTFSIFLRYENTTEKNFIY